MLRFVERNKLFVLLAVILVSWVALGLFLNGFVEQPVAGVGFSMLLVAVACMRLAYLRDHEAS
jgi:hypothetical protein